MSTRCVFASAVSRRGRWFLRVGVLAVTILIPIWLAVPSRASDPFYNRLMQDGIGAYGIGDYESAAKSLRLACFGLLDEPLVLARGLTYLALAQAQLGDEEKFVTTFERILEVERRFQGFSQLELSPDLQLTLDTHVHAWIPLDLLRRAPAFSEVARRKQESAILEMEPAERRLELERLVAVEPESPLWGLLLAELQLDSGDYEAVQTAVEGVLARDPTLGRALCLRGRAGAKMGSCQQALVDLESCHDPMDPMELIEARLRCHVRLSDWQSASTLLAEVPPDRQKRTPFRQLARDIRKGRRSAPVPETTTESSTTDDSPDIANVSELDLIATPDEASTDESAVAELPQEDTPETATPEEPQPEDAPTALPPALKAELEQMRQVVLSSSREALDTTCLICSSSALSAGGRAVGASSG